MRNLFKLALPVAALGLVLFVAPAARAVTDTANQTVGATVSPYASLSIDSATVTFANADPTTASIDATEGALGITADARTTTAGAVTLTVVADGDLTSGSDSIDISNLTWVKTGTGYVAGTMSKTTPQTVATRTGSGTLNGTISYKLANSLSYATGSYSASLLYTLTAP